MGAAARKLISGVSALALTVGLAVAAPAVAQAGVGVTPRVLINEVYGGGGNSGATQTNDYVELFNGSDAPVSLVGWSVQYAGATGATWATTPLSGSIAAGGYYLVGEAAGAGGSVTPTFDVAGSLAMSGTAGKVALVNSTTALSCATGCSTTDAVVDFVGYGPTASDSAGGVTAPLLSNTTSASRNAAHANTANNGADFTAGAPSPSNSGAAPEPPTPPDAGTRTIAEIQGTGADSPLVGSTVTTTGVVTAAYPTGGFTAFVIQTAGTGGALDPAVHKASDALYVYASGTGAVDTVAVGDFVSVKGQVSEFFGLTELTLASAADVIQLDKTGKKVTPATTGGWPATDAAREPLESMLYRPLGTFTVTNTFATNQFGEVGLAFGSTPLIQWTEVARPGSTAANAVKADNAARAVTLDDGASTNFLSAANSSQTPPYISNSKPVRVGATALFTKPVIVDYRNNVWKFQPIAQVTPAAAGKYPATFADTRTTAPDAQSIGAADLKVGSFNVLNYFTTLGADVAGCTSFNDRAGNPIAVNTCPGNGPRGAWNTENLQRQQSKIVKAINALDADVVGLMEIENSAVVEGQSDAAVSRLVRALNNNAGADVWAYVPSSSELPDAALMDVITNAIIYKKAAVQRVGGARALGTQSAGNQPFANAREPIAQGFRPSGGGEPFLFVVNHFKSKGSAGPYPGDVDKGDGQGASNESRVHQAEALRDWVPTVLPAGTESVVMVGDYNSYGKEDPLQVLFDAGYTDAEQHFELNKYSYSFSGLSGSLDHVLVNNAALARATGADIWNINSPESIALEYSRYNYHGTLFYRSDPYASSDHDPVVLGLKASTPPTEVQVLGINDFHGRIRSNGVEAGAAVLAGAVKQLRSQQPKTVFAAAGDLIGASTFESFIAHDKPTLDALNSAGLEVSAVGNHEFDQGYNDLKNRVMKPYNAATNPFGGASWQYLGANVRKTADGSAALPESWVQNFGDVTVGFVGAVTDHLPELVSPAGIAGLTIEAPVIAANREADRLKAAGADIVVLLVHEGAATTALSSATDPASDMGRIVNGADENIDAIISGHTHLAYNHAIPVQKWIDEGRPVTSRPVVSAGQYGYNLNQLVFKVDRTGTVVGIAQNILPLVTTIPGTPVTYKNNYPADGDTQLIVDKAVKDAEVPGAAKLGDIDGPLNRAKLANGSTENRGGESTLGNLVAEVQRWATEKPESGTAQIAFMNPGGLRDDMVGNNANGYPAVLTYKQAAVVQPFANTLVNMRLTGAQIRSALEQQWQPAGSARPFLRLGASKGFTYTYDPTAAPGSRITAMYLDNEPVTDAGVYSVTVNSFLASGGDNFGAFATGTSKRDTGKTDLQGMVDYMAAHTPLAVDYTQRAVGVHFPSGAPAEYRPGDTVAFALSSLAFSTAADTKDSSVTVKLGDTLVGTFPVDNTIGTDIRDEYGTAAVSFTLPSGLGTGAQELTVTGTTTGTTATVPVTLAAPAGPVDLTFLDINDFHGRIDANTVKFAGTVEQQRAAAGEDSTAFVSAGDNVGASLFASAVAQDQPTIDVLNALGLQASAVGNHEFDKGFSDLTDRIINNGSNAKWKYLGANVYLKGTTTPALSEYQILTLNGVKVGVIGAVTEETPSLVTPGGITTLDFGDPVDAVNRVAAQLTDGDPANGEADVLVATYHEGAGAGTPDGATLAQEVAAGGAFAKIVTETSPKVAAIFTGHTHKEYVWDGPVPGAAGKTRPILQTGSYGERIGKITLTFDRSTQEVTAYTAVNVPRTTTADDVLIGQFPRVAQVNTIVTAALAAAAEVGNQPVSSVTADITTAFFGAGSAYSGPGDTYVGPTRDDRSKESTLGNLVANSLVSSLSSTERGAAEIGVVNPGGLRDELRQSPDGVITYAEANGVLPFVNNLWTVSLTGAQFTTLLEQQWQTDAKGNVPASRPYLQLGLSDNVSYTYDATAAQGAHITSVTVDGAPLDPAASYRIGTFSFLATGGDNFRIFTSGTDVKDSGLIDRDAWIDYLTAHAPLTPDFARHAVSVPAVPTEVKAGAAVNFAVGGLNLTSLGSPRNTELQIKLGDEVLGTVPVATTIADVATDPRGVQNGLAQVSATLPEGTPAGPAVLTLVAAPSGTTVRLPITVLPGQTESTTTVKASAADQTYGTRTPVTFTATVKLANGAPPAGTVTFTSKGAELGSVPVSADGTAKLVLPASTAAQTLAVVAAFNPADPLVAKGSASTPLTFTVRMALSTTGLTLSWLKSGTKFALTMRATVGLNTGQAAAGTVSFNVNGAKVGSAAVSGGVATLTATVPAGATTVVVSFVPTSTSVSRSGKTVTATVKAAASSTALALTSVKAGTAFRLTATATVSLAGKPAPTGAVTFTVKGKKAGTVTLARGVATLRVIVPKGATTVVATFAPTGSAPVAGSSRTATRTVK